jgi:hypothetical protein
MNTTLRSLLTAIGVVVAGGITAVIYVAQPGTTLADLQDAGIGACVQGEALCQVYDADGGHHRLRVRGSACQEPDGTWAVIPDPDALDGMELVMTHDGAACKRATGANKLKVNEKKLAEPEECACAPFPVVGTCKYLGATAPHRLHMRPGEWSGGCSAMPCGALAIPGTSPWPADLCGPE